MASAKSVAEKLAKSKALARLDDFLDRCGVSVDEMRGRAEAAERDLYTEMAEADREVPVLIEEKRSKFDTIRAKARGIVRKYNEAMKEPNEYFSDELIQPVELDPELQDTDLAEALGEWENDDKTHFLDPDEVGDLEHLTLTNDIRDAAESNHETLAEIRKDAHAGRMTLEEIQDYLLDNGVTDDEDEEEGETP